MITYEYACTACGHTLRIRQRITSAPITEDYHRTPRGASCRGPMKRQLFAAQGWVPGTDTPTRTRR